MLKNDLRARRTERGWTQAELAGGEVRCPECKRKLSEADGLRFVQGFGQAEPSLAALNCPRCRTMISIRIITAT